MSKLYTVQLLALASELAQYPMHDAFEVRTNARSPVCGSTLELGIALGPSEQIEELGLQVTACAIGQSSAAIMAGAIRGKTRADMQAVLADIRVWLKGDGKRPDWPRFEALEPTLPHPGRHGALLLAWEAAAKAFTGEHSTPTLSSGVPSR